MRLAAFLFGQEGLVRCPQNRMRQARMRGTGDTGSPNGIGKMTENEVIMKVLGGGSFDS